MFGFKKGVAIVATAFDEARSLMLVTLTSSEPLARGSTADVYQGETPEHVFRDRLVALKVYTTTLVPNQAREQLCRREIRVGRHARHPFILPFLGVATLGCYTIIVTPFMKNGDVSQYLLRYPLANRNRLVIQVAKGINYLHNKIGVVHGDLKCENILVSDDDMIQLSDFGLCTRAEKGARESAGQSHPKTASFSQASASSHSIPSSRVVSSNQSIAFSNTFSSNRNKYTVGFAAPELFLEEDCELLPARTTESDIYAFGAVMLQIFSGEPPGGRTSFYDRVIEAQTGGKTPKRNARDISRGLITCWWKLCLDCLRSRPSERPAIGVLVSELKSTSKMANLLSFLQWSAYRPHEFAKWREILFSSTIYFSQKDYSKDILTAAAYLWRESIGIEQAGRNQQLSAILDVLADALLGLTLQASSAMRPIRELLDTSSARGYGAWPFPLPAPSYLAPSSTTFLNENLVVSGPLSDPLRMSWDAFSGARVALPATLLGDFTCVAVSASGRHGAVGSSDGNVHIWTSRDDGRIQPVQTVKVSEDGAIQVMSLSPDGLCLATSSDGLIRVWDAVAGTQIGHVSEKLADNVVCLACTSDGVRAATVTKSRRHSLCLWQWSPDCPSLQSLGQPLAGDYLTPRVIAFSPDGGRIAAGSWDGTVRIWDARTAELQFALTGHTDAVNAVAFSHQGTHLASASQDRTVRVWNARTGAPVGVASHTGGVRSVAFSPDGSVFASRANDGTVRVWNRISAA